MRFKILVIAMLFSCITASASAALLLDSQDKYWHLGTTKDAVEVYLDTQESRLITSGVIRARIVSRSANDPSLEICQYVMYDIYDGRVTTLLLERYRNGKLLIRLENEINNRRPANDTDFFARVVDYFTMPTAISNPIANPHSNTNLVAEPSLKVVLDGKPWGWLNELDNYRNMKGKVVLRDIRPAGGWTTSNFWYPNFNFSWWHAEGPERLEITLDKQTKPFMTWYGKPAVARTITFEYLGDRTVVYMGSVKNETNIAGTFHGSFYVTDMRGTIEIYPAGTY